jgi:hypothetical protein
MRKPRPRSVRTIGEHISTMRVNVRRRGLAWRLTNRQAAEFMLAPCHYCGAWPSPFNGIDRRGNEPFYSAKNTVACCWPCNRAKATGTAEDLIRHANRIVAQDWEGFDWMQLPL